MIAAKQHPPVILLLGERTRGSSGSVDNWLAESRYSAQEATDVFQALEQLSDFTLRDRPDVVFLHSDSAANDLEFVQILVTTSADEPDVPIIDLTSELKTRDSAEFERTIAGLVCKLDEFIPKHDTAKM